MKSEMIRVRVSKEFKELVEKQASKQNRTMSNYIENLIKNDIERESNAKEDETELKK